MSNPIDVAVNTYQENIQKLIEYLSDYESDEHGFYSSLTTKINTRLADHDVNIPDQYVPDWYNLRKAQKRGLDIISAVKLGYGAGLSKDPNLACALVYLALTGIWDVEVESLASIVKRLTGETIVTEDISDDVDQLNRIELKLDHVVNVLDNGVLSKEETLTWSVVKELTKFGMQPTKNNLPKLKKILEENAVGIEHYVPEVLDILKNNKKPDIKYWLLICALLNQINPEGNYNSKVLDSWINPKTRSSQPVFRDDTHNE